jgi:hypothetical protein
VVVLLLFLLCVSSLNFVSCLSYWIIHTSKVVVVCGLYPEVDRSMKRKIETSITQYYEYRPYMIS